MKPLGVSPFGAGGSSGSFWIESAYAIGSNRVLIVFSSNVKQESPLGFGDALNPDNYVLSSTEDTEPPVVSTITPGDTAREVIVNMNPDMEPETEYTITVSDARIAEGIGIFIDPKTAYFDSPSFEKTLEDKAGNDLALELSPEISGFTDSELIELGGHRVDGTGDYAFSDTDESLKKRIRKRLIVSKGGYVHLPKFGLGLKKYKGMNRTSAVLRDIQNDIVSQVNSEADVESSSVSFSQPVGYPRISVINIRVKTKRNTELTISFPHSWE